MANDKRKHGGQDQPPSVPIAKVSIAHLMVAFGAGVVLGMKFGAATKGGTSKLPGQKWVTDNRGFG